MTAEQFPELTSNPELAVRLCIVDEIFRSEDVVGTEPWMHTPESAPGWGEELYLAEAFRRAHTVLQGVSYGNSHWRDTYGLGKLADPAACKDMPEGAQEMTQRLLEIVALSRVSLHARGEHWRLPVLGEVIGILAEMRNELGAGEEWKRDEYLLGPHFPGVTYNQVMDALVGGSLRIGNPREPSTICYSPIPFYDAPIRKNNTQPDEDGDQVTTAINLVTDSLTTDEQG